MAVVKVDRVIEEFDKSMKLLRSALRGVPYRTGSFHKQHDNLARDVALLLVQLETVRGRVR